MKPDDGSKADARAIVQAALAVHGNARLGQGFSDVDATVVSRLLRRYRLGPPELAAVHGVLARYRDRLARVGLNFDLLRMPAVPTTLTIAPEPHKTCDVIVLPMGKYQGVTLGRMARDDLGGREYLYLIGRDAKAPEWRAAARAVLHGQRVIAPRVQGMVRPIAENTGVVTITAKSATKLQVSFPYHEGISARIMDIDGRRWDADSRVWLVPAAQVRALAKALEGASWPVIWDDTAVGIRDRELARRATLDATRVKLDTEIVIPFVEPHQPRPYQKVAVEFVVHAGGRAYVADEMGLGKTIDWIAYACMTQQRGLVIVPATAKLNWCLEIEKFTGIKPVLWGSGGKIRRVKVGPVYRTFPEESPYHVVSYEAFARIWPTLAQLEFTLLGVDEAHRLRNPKTVVCKAIYGDWNAKDEFPGFPTKDVMLLSGTPILNRPGEAFAPLHFLDKTRFPSRFIFERRYGKGTEDDPARNLEELHDRCRDLMIRRLKKQVQPELPPKVTTDVFVELSKAQRERYDALVYKMFQGWKAKGRVGIVEMHILQEAIREAKLVRAWEMLDELVAAGRTALLFSTRLDPLKRTKERYGSKAGLITGDETLGARQYVVERIQGKECQVGCLSLMAAGVALTLTEADTVIFLDLDWVPLNHTQAEDRAHRDGLKHTLDVYYLLADGTIDTILREVHVEKMRIATTITEGTAQTDPRGRSVFGEFLRRLRDAYRDDFPEAEALETTPSEDAA